MQYVVPAGSRLTILGPAKGKESRPYVLARCKCGSEKVYRADNVVNGKVRSCGCLTVEKSTERALAMTKHGHARLKRSPTYLTWRSMHIRCCGSDKDHYQAYAAKGISVCERWNSFENFLADMGERPEGCTIDRIDSSKGYEPANCRWATKKEQSQNRSCTRWIEFEGRTQTLSDWATEIGISVSGLKDRIDKKKLPLSIALTEKTRKGRRWQALIKS